MKAIKEKEKNQKTELNKQKNQRLLNFLKYFPDAELIDIQTQNGRI